MITGRSTARVMPWVFAWALVAALMHAVVAGLLYVQNIPDVYNPWYPVGEQTYSANMASQGVMTVYRDGHDVLTPRGSASIPDTLRRAGWNHIGDPDSWNGWTVDPYQRPNGDEKGYRFTGPAGRVLFYTHHLLAGEMLNNSWVSITPDGRYLVTGEWGTNSRFLVFRMPHLAEPGRSRELVYVNRIGLNHSVQAVQGCDFADPVTLVCATNELWDNPVMAHQLLQIALPHPVDGRHDTGSVARLGMAPTDPQCRYGYGETEGVDVTGHQLAVVVRSLCAPVSSVYLFDREF